MHQPESKKTDGKQQQDGGAKALGNMFKQTHPRHSERSEESQIERQTF